MLKTIKILGLVNVVFATMNINNYLNRGESITSMHGYTMMKDFYLALFIFLITDLIYLLFNGIKLKDVLSNMEKIKTDDEDIL